MAAGKKGKGGGEGEKRERKKGKSLTLSPQSPSLLLALPPRDPLRPYPLRHLLRRLPYFPLLACPNSPLASPFTPATQAMVKCDYPNKPLTLAWPSALSRPGGPNNSLATVVYLAGNRKAVVVFSGKPHVQRAITRKQKNNNNKMISAQGNHLLVLKRKSSWSKLTNPGKLNCFFMKAPVRWRSRFFYLDIEMDALFVTRGKYTYRPYG